MSVSSTARRCMLTIFSRHEGTQGFLHGVLMATIIPESSKALLRGSSGAPGSGMSQVRIVHTTSKYLRLPAPLRVWLTNRPHREGLFLVKAKFK